MKRTRCFTLFFAVILSFATVYSNNAFAQDQTHTVRSGETLFSISRQYNVSVEELRQLNNLRDNQLSIGQVLVVSRTVPSIDPDSELAQFHRVQPGETLFSISQRYEVSVQDIMTWNNLNSTSLSIGQRLRVSEEAPAISVNNIVENQETPIQTTEISGFAPIATSGNFYIVEPGDTMFRIARRHNMTVSELMDLNNRTNTALEIGDRLLVRAFRQPPSVLAEQVRSTPQGAFIAHNLSAGESIRDVLRHYQMDLDEFFALNPDKEIDDLRTGDRVVLLAPSTIVTPNPYRITRQTSTINEILVGLYNANDTARTLTSGELYNPNHLTAAHPTLPLGTAVYVENPENGLGIFVLINDRSTEPLLRLSHAAFQALAYSENSSRVAIIYLD